MIDERYHRFLIECGSHKIAHSGRSFLAHLEGTHELLRSWKLPDYICDAGLFHSIYGTKHFQHESFPIARREVIQDLVGCESEQLIYLFCVTDRPTAFLDQIRSRKPRLRDYHLNCEIDLAPGMLGQLLEIEAANLLDQGGKHRGALHALCSAPISRTAKLAVLQRLEQLLPEDSCSDA